MLDLKDKLVVALDVNTLKEVRKLVNTLRGKVKFYKITNRLLAQYGPKVLQIVRKMGGKVFLDLKFHDIPNTVQYSCYSSTSSGSSIMLQSICSYLPAGLKENQGFKNIIQAQYPVFMITVHTDAGVEGLRSAVKGAKERAEELHIDRPLIVGVTLLTSEKPEADALGIVLERAHWVKEAGLDGVVCSALEARKVREAFGNEFIIVTPGIRPKGYSANDQKRVTTAREAIDAGANYIVVGRPILDAKDPLKAIKDLSD
ncbi:MAG: orotidine-5'-phosphate decarboxylase [Candidatus Omnitrophica bacterium]|nr:orotidine-5'-phosphate decarboxylase [Candidatus Omnitrophota bacterium]MBU1923028.1 orotidine-5'-phosphate decarboxylase [Candidatus Omnitrophota bacterium]